MKTPKPPKPPPSPKHVPLPTLSDEAAVQLYLFVEHIMLLIESRYSGQIRRHFSSQEQHNLMRPDPDTPLTDPPF